MKNSLIKDSRYSLFICTIKERIQSAQIKAAISVNIGLITLYWDMAERIVDAQKKASWGDGFLQQLSEDLQDSFPEMKGFSLRNLKYMRQWYLFWIDKTQKNIIGQQVVAQLARIPWGHNLVISKMGKIIGIDFGP